MPSYTHGQIIKPNGEPRSGRYRKVEKSGDVEFVLWEAGEHGHKTPFWHRMGSGWSESFIKGYPSELEASNRLEF